MRGLWQDRKALAWAFYDFANSGFATTVMAGLFPIFFKQFYCAGVEPAVSTARLGWGNSGASLAVALIAPFAGTVADACSGRKRLLLRFTIAGALFTALLALPQSGQWLSALFIYAAALFCFAVGNIFYDALLNDVASNRKRDEVSSLGFALGYLGGGTLLLINVAMVIKPELFAIKDPAMAVRISFIAVAAWWILFSIPLFTTVEETKKAVRCSSASALTEIGRRLNLKALANMGRAPLLFLAAYWLYMDGVSSVIRMAVDYGLSIGIGSKGLLSALLIVQFSGFPATILMAKAAERLGTKKTILAGITAYGAVTLWASSMHSLTEFLILAATIGIFQGSLQALSRSFFSKMIPRGCEAEYFGFYNVMGRFAAVLGPALIGTAAAYSGSTRSGILVLIPMFVLGAFLLMLVKDGEVSSG